MLSGRSPRIRHAAAAAAFTVLCVAAAAQQPSAPLARQIADGAPWRMTMLTEGRRATMTLYPDGTGRMEGAPMAMSPTWRATADGICLKPAAIAPERCVVLTRDGRAVVGVRDGVPQFRLER